MSTEDSHIFCTLFTINVYYITLRYIIASIKRAQGNICQPSYLEEKCFSPHVGRIQSSVKHFNEIHSSRTQSCFLSIFFPTAMVLNAQTSHMSTLYIQCCQDRFTNLSIQVISCEKQRVCFKQSIYRSVFVIKDYQHYSYRHRFSQNPSSKFKDARKAVVLKQP